MLLLKLQCHSRKTTLKSTRRIWLVMIAFRKYENVVVLTQHFGPLLDDCVVIAKRSKTITNPEYRFDLNGGQQRGNESFLKHTRSRNGPGISRSGANHKNSIKKGVLMIRNKNDRPFCWHCAGIVDLYLTEIDTPCSGAIKLHTPEQ